MKSVSYTRRALLVLKRNASVADRIRRAVNDYASGSGARANNVTQLVARPEKRLRVGDWRVIFSETDAEIVVLDIGPRGDIYR